MPNDLSVVIPTFRRPRPLREALASVLVERDISLDVLVVDDSPEGSARGVVDEIDDARVTYFHRATPSGGNPSVVRNDGWTRVTGEYIHFLDDDDLVADGAYPALLGALDRNPRRGVAFGVIDPFGDNPVDLAHEQAYFKNAAKRARLVSWLSSQRLIALNMLFKTTLLVNSACIIRRSCVAQLGGYNPRARMDEDVEFYARAIRRFGAVFVDQVVMRYRTGAPSLMRNRVDNSEILKTYAIMYDSYRAAYGAIDLLMLKVLARTLLRWL